MKPAVVAIVALGAVVSLTAQDRPGGQGFSFRTGVALTSVSATVTDAQGRFVTGLSREDFVLYEDGMPQEISQFESERVPVSLGIALDTSGSMVGEKMTAAKAALNRFLLDLLGPEDDVFVYRFDSRPMLVQDWTRDRTAASRMLSSVKPVGGTSIFDTVAEAVPMAQRGVHRKKAIVVISDGNDTNSQMGVTELQRLIRESEVLVYAIGIDASGEGSYTARPSGNTASSGGNTASSGGTRTLPQPSPFPGKKPAVPPTVVTSAPPPAAPSSSSSSTRASRSGSSVDRVNPDVLRAITDDSGGRTEIIVSPRDLDPATAGIADELSRQYFLGYLSPAPKDGKWHTIELRLKKGNGTYTVRARRGFISG